MIRSIASRARRRAKAVVNNLKKDATSVHETVKAAEAPPRAPVQAAPAPKPPAPAVQAATPKPEAKPAAAPKPEAKQAAAPKPGAKQAAAPKPGANRAAAPKAEPVEAPAPALGFAALAARAAAGDLNGATDATSTDLEAYQERAKLLGRDVDLAGEGLNTSDDGATFWGPIDCESSRAKATGLVLNIDQELCISCGTCEENTDAVFYLPNEEDAKAEVLAQDGPMDLIQDAIDACPVMCISWLGDGELPERVSPTPSELSEQRA